MVQRCAPRGPLVPRVPVIRTRSALADLVICPAAPASARARLLVRDEAFQAGDPASQNAVPRAASEAQAAVALAHNYRNKEEELTGWLTCKDAVKFEKIGSCLTCGKLSLAFNGIGDREAIALAKGP